MHFRLAAAFIPFLAIAIPVKDYMPVAYSAAKHGGPYMFNYYLPPAPSSSPWAPSWSPDGNWLAVAMQGSIWKVDVRTGAATELTDGAGYASSPTWSPDGKWIVFTVDSGGERIQLAALDVATGETRSLTEDTHLYLDPVFSPDGTRLAYVSTQPNGYFNIFVRGIRDGRWTGEAAAVTRDHEYPRDRLYFGPWDMHTQPAWTPRGDALVFVTNRDVPLGSGDLWIAPAKENGMAEGRMLFREQTLYRTRPHVSPDGRRVVYASFAGGADQFNNLYVIPVAGGAPYKLTFGAFDHFHPRWSPDGRRIAFLSNESGQPQLCLEDVTGGAERRLPITARQWRRPIGRLRLRVIDTATGRPTPARILGRAADGRFYAPWDVSSRRGADGRHNFYTGGVIDYDLAPGPISVQAVRGFEHEPARGTVTIQAGATIELTLRLKRIDSPAARGWHSGTTHAHMNYGGNLHNTPENLAAMAAGEDLAVVNALVANKDNRVLDWQYFRPGGAEYLLRGVHILFGEEYRPAFWAHSFLLGLREHLISPFTSNYEATALDTLTPTNAEVFRLAKAQGAITGYVHPFGDSDPLEGERIGGPPTLPIDAALGVLDALEWSSAMKSGFRVWHKLLDNGIRLTPAGGEDSINDLQYLRTLGAVRTYVAVPGPLSAVAWLEGMKKGHTFFTTGPLLDFTVNGQLPGDDISLPAGGGGVRIEGAVRCAAPLSRIVIHYRGGVLKEIPVDATGRGASFRFQHQVAASDWFALSAEGPEFEGFDAQFPLAGTNAIRVFAGDGKIRDRAAAEYFLRWIEKARHQCEQWPWWESQAAREQVMAQFDEGRRIYERLASEAAPATPARAPSSALRISTPRR